MTVNDIPCPDCKALPYRSCVKSDGTIAMWACPGRVRNLDRLIPTGEAK